MVIPYLLLVSADPTLRDFIRLLLLDWRVVDVASGLEALQCLTKQPAEVIILDENLGDIELATMVDMLKTAPPSRAIPIIVLSGGGLQVRAQVIRLGADGCLRKPVCALELHRKLQTLLPYAALLPQAIPHYVAATGS
jgi:two-component system phosphate regulon response regulator PhoB